MYSLHSVYRVSVHVHTYVHAYKCTSSYTYVATGSRKRPRPSQEDEGVSRVKQREVLSDQSNKAKDIGPAPVVYERRYAFRKKSSVQSNQVRTYVIDCKRIMYVYLYT